MSTSKVFHFLVVLIPLYWLLLLFRIQSTQGFEKEVPDLFSTGKQPSSFLGQFIFLITTLIFLGGYGRGNSKQNKNTQQIKEITCVFALKVSICSNTLTFPAMKTTESTFPCVYPRNHTSLAICPFTARFHNVGVFNTHVLPTTVHPPLTLPHSGCISTHTLKPLPAGATDDSFVTQPSKAQTQPTCPSLGGWIQRHKYWRSDSQVHATGALERSAGTFGGVWGRGRSAYGSVLCLDGLVLPNCRPPSMSQNRPRRPLKRVNWTRCKLQHNEPN